MSPINDVHLIVLMSGLIAWARTGLMSTQTKYPGMLSVLWYHNRSSVER